MSSPPDARGDDDLFVGADHDVTGELSDLVFVAVFAGFEVDQVVADVDLLITDVPNDDGLVFDVLLDFKREIDLNYTIIYY